MKNVSCDESLKDYIGKHMANSNEKNEALRVLESFQEQGTQEEEDVIVQSIYDKAKDESVNYIYIAVYYGSCFSGTVKREDIFVMSPDCKGIFNDSQLDKIIILESSPWLLLNTHVQVINGQAISGSAYSTETSLMVLKYNIAGSPRYAY